MIYACSATVSVDSNVFLDICGDSAAEHEIAFNCNKTIGVRFCPKNYKQTTPPNVFLNGVAYVYNFVTM